MKGEILPSTGSLCAETWEVNVSWLREVEEEGSAWYLDFEAY